MEAQKLLLRPREVHSGLYSIVSRNYAYISPVEELINHQMHSALHTRSYRLTKRMHGLEKMALVGNGNTEVSRLTYTVKVVHGRTSGFSNNLKEPLRGTDFLATVF